MAINWTQPRLKDNQKWRRIQIEGHLCIFSFLQGPWALYYNTILSWKGKCSDLEVYVCFKPVCVIEYLEFNWNCQSQTCLLISWASFTHFKYFYHFYYFFLLFLLFLLFLIGLGWSKILVIMFEPKMNTEVAFNTTNTHPPPLH